MNMVQKNELTAGNRTSLVLYGNRSIPLYRMVKEELILFLQKKGIKSGMVLPTEKELAAQFGVSIGTVRRAIDELVSERIVIRQQGRGTFLAPYDTTRMINSFWHIQRKDGVIDVPVVSMLDFQETRLDERVAKNLNVPPGTPAFMILNVMKMGGERVLLDRLHVPAHLFAGLTKEKLAARDATIYDFYREAYGINIVKTTDRVTATTADRETAQLLGCKVGKPLLQVIRVAYSFGDQAVEHRCSLLDSENHEYFDVTGGDMGR